MVPKQEPMNRDESSSDSSDVTLVEQPLFGSQLVDENSPTPYSDATQVRYDKKKKKMIYMNYNDVMMAILIVLITTISGNIRAAMSAVKN